jgi:molybdopterin-guanine dinucleotide biosynthesis protein A
MGRPKAWMKVGGRTMAAVVVDALREGLQRAWTEATSTGGTRGDSEAGKVAGDLPPMVVVGAPDQELPPLPGVVVTRDEVAEQGPLQGMAAGLAALQGRADAAYVSSCDVPLLRPAFVSRMLDLLGDADIVVPDVEGRHHPLAGVYRLSILPMVHELLSAGRRRPFFLFDRVRKRTVGPNELRPVDPELVSLRNINTKEEYERLLKSSGSGT